MVLRSHPVIHRDHGHAGHRRQRNGFHQAERGRAAHHEATAMQFDQHALGLLGCARARLHPQHRHAIPGFGRDLHRVARAQLRNHAFGPTLGVGADARQLLEQGGVVGLVQRIGAGHPGGHMRTRGRAQILRHRQVERGHMPDAIGGRCGRRWCRLGGGCVHAARGTNQRERQRFVQPMTCHAVPSQASRTAKDTVSGRLASRADNGAACNDAM